MRCEKADSDWSFSDHFRQRNQYTWLDTSKSKHIIFLPESDCYMAMQGFCSNNPWVVYYLILFSPYAQGHGLLP